MSERHASDPKPQPEQETDDQGKNELAVGEERRRSVGDPSAGDPDAAASGIDLEPDDGLGPPDTDREDVTAHPEVGAGAGEMLADGPASVATARVGGSSVTGPHGPVPGPGPDQDRLQRDETRKKP